MDTSETRGYDFKAAYGFAPGVQGWASYSDTLYYKYHSSYYGYNRHLVSQQLDLGGDWVSTHARAGGQLHHDESTDDAVPVFDKFGTLENWSALGYFGYQAGGRPATPAEAAGNWNGFFSPQLSQGQYDIEGTLVLMPQEDRTDARVAGSLRYGVLEPLTVGLDYDLRFYEENEQLFFLTACLSNIPRRTQGPRQVSALEYQLGALPKAGEARLLASVMLPGSDAKTYGTSTDLQIDPQARYASTWDRQRRGWTRLSEARSDVRLEGMAGLSDAFLLQADLARVDRFRSSLADEDSYDVKNAWVVGLGLGYHVGGLLFQLRLPWYTGTGIQYWNSSSEAIEKGMDSRFGPVALHLIANY